MKYVKEMEPPGRKKPEMKIRSFNREYPTPLIVPCLCFRNKRKNVQIMSGIQQMKICTKANQRKTTQSHRLPRRGMCGTFEEDRPKN